MSAARSSRDLTGTARPTRTPRNRAELITSTLDAIRVLDLATSRFRAATAQGWQVTVSDSLVMSNLAMAGGEMTPRDLARRLMISSGTLTSMLDRLEAAAYIARIPNPNDRRSLLIQLTETGHKSLFYTRDRLGAALDDALPRGATPELLETMLALAAAIDAATDDLLNPAR